MDLEMIRRVMTLMDELGVNLAGVDVILRMSQQIAQLQKTTEELEDEIEKLRRE
jgi:MerR family transcriptional regulator, heat shock protein HspR